MEKKVRKRRKKGIRMRERKKENKRKRERETVVRKAIGRAMELWPRQKVVAIESLFFHRYGW